MGTAVAVASGVREGTGDGTGEGVGTAAGAPAVLLPAAAPEESGGPPTVSGAVPVVPVWTGTPDVGGEAALAQPAATITIETRAAMNTGFRTNRYRPGSLSDRFTGQEGLTARI